MSYQLSLEIILVVSSVCAVLFSVATRKIQYHGPNTDNELMVLAAAQSYKWRGFSDLHKYSLSPFKMGMKEFTVVLISVFQKILRDKESDHTYVTLGGTMVAASAVLIFLIGSHYWDPMIGLFIGLLFLLTFWPWQIALYGSHPVVAIGVALLAIYVAQQASTSNFAGQLLWLTAAGGILCLTLFSSASALKYIPLFWGAVIYEKYLLAGGNGLSGLYSLIRINDSLQLSLLLIALAFLAFNAVKVFYKKIVVMIYENRAPLFLNKIIVSRDKFDPDHYINHAGRKLKQLSLFLAFLLASFIFLINLIGMSWVVSIIAGFAITFIIINLPNIKESFGHYYAYLKDTQILNKHHFKLYVDFFAKRGITVTREYRGAGLQWLPKIFLRMAPVYTAVLAIGMAIFIFQAIILKDLNFTVNGVLILLISLSPTLWAEITRAPQIGRTYSPGFVGTILFVGYASYLLANIGSGYYYLILFSILGITAVVNSKIFLTDVFPSRMTITNLLEKIDSLKIKRLYTYDTSFNRCFVQAIPGIAVSDFMPHYKNIPAPFEVVYIQSIAEVEDGWIAIPGTSGKAVNMEADKWAILNGDYNLDPVLNKLLETKEIEKIATVKFKTHGTSKWWANESEVTSYRDLILHDISKEDRWRGHAWLLHSSKLKDAYKTNEQG